MVINTGLTVIWNIWNRCETKYMLSSENLSSVWILKKTDGCESFRFNWINCNFLVFLDEKKAKLYP